MANGSTLCFNSSLNPCMLTTWDPWMHAFTLESIIFHLRLLLANHVGFTSFCMLYIWLPIWHLVRDATCSQTPPCLLISLALLPLVDGDQCGCMVIYPCVWKEGCTLRGLCSHKPWVVGCCCSFGVYRMLYVFHRMKFKENFVEFFQYPILLHET